MNSKRFFLLCGGAAAIGGGLYVATTRKGPAQVGLGLDASPSVTLDCGAFRDAVKSFLKDKAAIRDGSTLSLLVMGTDARHARPTLGLSGLIPIAPDMVYGRDDQKFHETEAQFLDNIEQACRTAKAGTGSPILDLVKDTLSRLRSDALGCGPRRPCLALFKTDLDEDVNASLRATLQRAATDPDVSVPTDLARSIENQNIEITFCGTSEVRARGSLSATPETRMRIWKELFTQSDLVSFQPFCK